MSLLRDIPRGFEEVQLLRVLELTAWAEDPVAQEEAAQEEAAQEEELVRAAVAEAEDRAVVEAEVTVKKCLQSDRVIAGI
jgi:hypothetical protein